MALQRAGRPRDIRGRIALVSYGEVPPVYHMRIVIAQLASSVTELGVYTPDGDRYFEDFSGEDGSIQEVFWCSSDGVPPEGVDRARIYRFAEWPSEQDLVVLYRLAGQEAAQLDRAAGVQGPEAGAPWLLAAAAGQPPGVPAAARGPLLPRPVAAPPRAGRFGAEAAEVFSVPRVAAANWVLAESRGRVGEEAKRGDPVTLDGSEVLRGDRGLAPVGEGKWVLIANLGTKDPEEFRVEEAHLDARVLPVTRDTAKKRHKPWRDVCASLTELASPDWSIPGPRTTYWCCMFINKRGGGPVDWDRFWRTVNRLSFESWGVAEHEALLKSIENMGCFDQLELCNLAGVEVLFRRAQLIEYFYFEAGRRDEAGKKGAGKHGPSMEETSVFTGANRDFGECMVAPSLIDHVAKEVERDASIMKQLRKAREERALHKKSDGQK